MGQRVAIYCRVSICDQSCDRQEWDLRAFAERGGYEGYEVVGVFKETASGSKDQRAQRGKVAALARDRLIQAVLVTELTRWGRSTTDLLHSLREPEACGVSVPLQTGLQFDLTSPQGKLFASLVAALAEFEQDLHLALDPPQVYIAHAKGGSDGYVPILPSLAQELRTHLAGRRTGYLFESNRHDRYTARAIQLIVQDTARRAGIEKTVTLHRLRASVATLLLDAGMPLDQVQKFLRHKRIVTIQTYAQTSARNMGESYLRALSGHP